MELTIKLAQATKLPEFTSTETWSWKPAAETQFDFSLQSSRTLGLFQSPLQRRDIWLDPATSRTFGLQQHRLQAFTEEVASFKVPLKANRKQKAHAMAVSPDNSIHGTNRSPLFLRWGMYAVCMVAELLSFLYACAVLTTCPMSLHSFSDIESTER